MKSLWKANELRAALAREGQLSADLDAARARVAVLETQVPWTLTLKPSLPTLTLAADLDAARARVALLEAQVLNPLNPSHN